MSFAKVFDTSRISCCTPYVKRKKCCITDETYSHHLNIKTYFGTDNKLLIDKFKYKCNNTNC